MHTFDQQALVCNDRSSAADHFDTATPVVCGNGSHDFLRGGLGADVCLTRELPLDGPARVVIRVGLANEVARPGYLSVHLRDLPLDTSVGVPALSIRLLHHDGPVEEGLVGSRDVLLCSLALVPLRRWRVCMTRTNC